MFRSLVAAVVGMVLGAGLGCLAAWVLYGPSAPEPRWTSYRTLAEETRPAQGAAVLHQTEVGPPEFRYWLFAGLLFGGGFGLVAGAVVGAAGATVAAIKGGRRSPQSSEAAA